MTSDPSMVGLENLAPEHFEALQQAFSRVPSTDLAAETFAQVVDGRPTRDVYQDYYNGFRSAFHNNLRPSDAALEAVESYCRDLAISSLEIDAKVAQSYQDTIYGSREFNLRLVGILATLCHNVAVCLYNAYDGGFHKPEPPPEMPTGLPPLEFELPKPKAKLVELFHPYYQFWEQYPHGLADVVGYWAEYRLFGGVVLFDRGETGSECQDIFIHPVGNYMIFQLSESQIQTYVDFLLSEQPEALSTMESIRFKTEEYARRVDPYDAMGLNIYRDKYERKIPETRPRRCVVRGEDIPGYKDAMEDFARRTRHI